MRRLIHVLMISLIAALIPLAALAKGAPVKIVISGSGIGGTVTISEPARLEAFTALNATSRIIKDAPDVDMDAGVRIDRYLVETSLWDTHTYYADPEGGLGYLFCNGNKYSGLYAQSREKWFRATPEVDAIMQGIIADAASEAPTALPAPPPMLIGGLGALGAALLLIAGVIEVRKRRGISAGA